MAARANKGALPDYQTSIRRWVKQIPFDPIPDPGSVLDGLRPDQVKLFHELLHIPRMHPQEARERVLKYLPDDPDEVINLPNPLQGAHRAPFFLPEASMNIRKQINHARRHATANVAELKKLGYRQIGKGAFARVLVHDDASDVLASTIARERRSGVRQLS